MGSDDNLLVAKRKLKLREYTNTNNSRATRRYNLKLLQDLPTLGAFQISLINRYQALADLYDDEQQPSTQEMWKERKEAWIETGPRSSTEPAHRMDLCRNLKEDRNKEKAERQGSQQQSKGSQKRSTESVQ